MRVRARRAISLYPSAIAHGAAGGAAIGAVIGPAFLLLSFIGDKLSHTDGYARETGWWTIPAMLFASFYGALVGVVFGLLLAAFDLVCVTLAALFARSFDVERHAPALTTIATAVAVAGAFAQYARLHQYTLALDVALIGITAVGATYYLSRRIVTPRN